MYAGLRSYFSCLISLNVVFLNRIFFFLVNHYSTGIYEDIIYSLFSSWNQKEISRIYHLFLSESKPFFFLKWPFCTSFYLRCFDIKAEIGKGSFHFTFWLSYLGFRKNCKMIFICSTLKYYFPLTRIMLGLFWALNSNLAPVGCLTGFLVAQN